MLKELTVKEALQLVAEKYPKPVIGWFWNDEEEIGGNINHTGVLYVAACHDMPFHIARSLGVYSHFGIDVEPEYRYMTQQEHNIWLVTVGYKNHQMRCKGCDWYIPFDLGCEKVDNYEYRTIQEIDGKIVYGQPQEFKVRVE